MKDFPGVSILGCPRAPEGRLILDMEAHTELLNDRRYPKTEHIADGLKNTGSQRVIALKWR